jgi:hypothetical protein
VAPNTRRKFRIFLGTEVTSIDEALDRNRLNTLTRFELPALKC